MKIYTNLGLSLSLILFTACGGSGESDGSHDSLSTAVIQTGSFIDSPVQGLRYQTPTQSGFTNATGEFHYINAETIEFFLGNYSLGSSTAKGLISPYTLYPNNEASAIKLAQLLQTLDKDNNLANGIEIDDYENFSDLDDALSLDDVNFITNVEGLLAKVLINSASAKSHLDETLYLNSLGNPNETATGTNAFNSFDQGTFSRSTCENLPFADATGIFVSINGTSSAAGTQNDPLDLATALSAFSPVEAGQTIWIFEGTYHGSFTSELKGTSTQHISVRPMLGQRVILDGRTGDSSALTVNGEWTDYYGLEVLSSAIDHTSEQDSSGPTDLKTNGGVSVYYGKNTRVINFIVHDNVGGGFSSWRPASNSELYGNIIYNNGWTAPDRGHGHAIYAQNEIGYKKLTNNIIFFGYATGIHVYTEGGQINGFDVQRNTWFMTGSSDPRSSAKKDNCLIGGFQPVKGLILKNNLGYSENARGTRIGYGGDVTGQDAVLNNNYLSENFWVAGHWNQLDVSNTTIVRGITGSSATYINDLGENNFQSSPPVSGKKIVVSANAHDPRRAKVVIFNYDEDASVSVDLSSVLKSGEAYRIHSAFALFNNPLVNGLYDGNSVSIPMGSITPPQPIGTNNIADEDDPHRKFGTFIITHGGCS
ncbi:MAG: hypothetical protein COA44_07705 [Arcobacter sp.]|nr:MAG: hypothetical protein COA44_07705 [Arcobacter sp.]